LEEKREALECMMKHLGKDPEPVIARMKNERLAGTTFGRIDIEHMTGKQSERPKQQ
jgi:nitroimidazol reductase NimA-like FMN-containing flavoprotein (pyridoxamine 5'-phosphate oxidase superfamily)